MKGPLCPGQMVPSAPPHPARTKHQSLPTKTQGAPICRPREELYLGPLCRFRVQGCLVARKGGGGVAGVGETAGDIYRKPSTFKVLISGARLISQRFPTSFHQRTIQKPLLSKCFRLKEQHVYERTLSKKK